MRILAIETSCDETAAAIIDNGTKIIESEVASSIDLHTKTGGIIPEAAAREQLTYILPVLNRVINRTYQKIATGPGSKLTILQILKEINIDALAVTIGPGLIGSLLIGIETAKSISALTGLPLIPVNHVWAHLYANFLQDKKIEFPAIGLVVSGGHTELFLLKNEKELKWLGGTLDDAGGEAFDKTARLLGLGYPGGPAISQAAKKSGLPINGTKWLPRPMINSNDLNFSFSGLKTAVLKEVNNFKKTGNFPKKINSIAYEIQESITDVLVKKTLTAAKLHHVKSILLGGGVSANARLKEKFIDNINTGKLNYYLFIPPPVLCTDNAAYIGSYAFFNYHPLPWTDIEAQPGLNVEV